MSAGKSTFAVAAVLVFAACGKSAAAPVALPAPRPALIGYALPAAFAADADGALPANLFFRHEDFITLRARLYLGDDDGAEIPVRRRKFYLLDDDLCRILRSEHFTTRDPAAAAAAGEPEMSDEECLTAAVELLFRTEDAEFAEFAGGETNSSISSLADEEQNLLAALLAAALAKHTVAALETDEAGRGRFPPNQKFGDYYLFGAARTDSQIFVWHQKLALNELTKSRLELDQYNAELDFAADEP